jgi:hypothetical protein
VRNEEVLQRIKDGRNIPQTIKIRKANWIGYILHTNVLIKHVITGEINVRIEVTVRRRRRRKQLLDDRREKKRYCKLKEEALDRTLLRKRVGKGYGTIARVQNGGGLKYTYSGSPVFKTSRLNHNTCFPNHTLLFIAQTCLVSGTV